ncbi:hypothetical protein [Maridesulfovibrio sp.]|uniref:hypothetical protein n=1 Tax=Maridesulfovibrio sp. TaxID=2795000 RepID=UPI002A18DE11|nr:hypothetical protein [Maridesulfovibrio sp.]
MLFSTLKTAIQHTEEKRFYDVATLYLRAKGYADIAVVDGPRDGGVDVTCSKEHVRIQLSVRKDWQNKINDEAQKTLSADKHHFVYITNKNISPDEEAKFLINKFKYKNEVDVSIHSLSKLATSLTVGHYSREAFNLLGISIPEKIKSELSEIATSTLLLFSPEAKELREEIIEANIKAILFENSLISKKELIEQTTTVLHYENINIKELAPKALARLRGAAKVTGSDQNLKLSDNEYGMIQTAKDSFSAMRQTDLILLTSELNIADEDASELFDTALEIIVVGEDFNGDSAAAESLRSLINQPKFRNKKRKIYTTLSKISSAKFKQYGAYLDQILKTDTFDIYRALGERSNIIMLLDSSVAMPVMFGLEFGDSSSRYEITANALRKICESHGIQLSIPRSYLNEMAAHGKLARERLQIYNELPPELQTHFKASKNAYLSHYTHINEKLPAEESLSLDEFLNHFGITETPNITSIENKIQSLLERHNINIVTSPMYDQDLYNQIKWKKPEDDEIIVNHDASTLTLIKEGVKYGYVLATWDKVMKNLVQNLARVLADTPTKVIDFLSMAKSENLANDSNIEIINTLLCVEESKITALAAKLDKIQDIKQAYKLNRIIDESRAKFGENWSVSPEDIDQVFEEEYSDKENETEDVPPN